MELVAAVTGMFDFILTGKLSIYDLETEELIPNPDPFITPWPAVS